MRLLCSLFGKDTIETFLTLLQQVLQDYNFHLPKTELSLPFVETGSDLERFVTYLEDYYCNCKIAWSEFIRFPDVIWTINCMILRTICAMVMIYAMAIMFYCVDLHHMVATCTSSANCSDVNFQSVYFLYRSPSLIQQMLC